MEKFGKGCMKDDSESLLSLYIGDSDNLNQLDVILHHVSVCIVTYAAGDLYIKQRSEITRTS
jgi:hypothetical protein